MKISKFDKIFSLKNYRKIILEIKKIIKFKSINYLDGKYKANLLHYAIIYNNFKVIKFLIKNKININEKDIEGYTPLHYTYLYKSYNITNFLIKKGADINIKNNYGKTPKEVDGKGLQIYQKENKILNNNTLSFLSNLNMNYFLLSNKCNDNLTAANLSANMINIAFSMFDEYKIGKKND